MEVEADVFMVFTGWSPKDTADMTLEELGNWHQIAIKRNQESQG